MAAPPDVGTRPQDVNGAKSEATGSSADEKWTRWINSAKDATRTALTEWIKDSEMLGKVEGPQLYIRRFFVRSPGVPDAYFFPIEGKLEAAGLPTKFAQRVRYAVENNWHAWTNNYKCSWPAYPTFENHSKPWAPLTLNVPFPLSSSWSIGLSNMQNPGPIAEELRLGLERAIHEPAALKATTDFANWFCTRFKQWYSLVQIAGIQAGGNVFGPLLSSTGKVWGGAKSKMRFLEGYPF